MNERRFLAVLTGSGESSGGRLTVLGFVENMPGRLRRADVVIGYQPHTAS